jgi:hypothetical protein
MKTEDQEERARAPFTVEIFEAEADAALAIDRARGAPIPKVDLVEDIYRVGFASGAMWALAVAKAAE